MQMSVESQKEGSQPQLREDTQETVPIVAGRPLVELPTDLYIPPDALQVFLDAFEGPLDLLLYLIRRQNIDILDVKISEITAQYVSYIELMRSLELELAGEYLLMASILAEIKSRLLLPRVETEVQEEDPRADLIRRLQEYEQTKHAAENLDAIPRLERDFFASAALKPDLVRQIADPIVDLKDLLTAFAEAMRRAEMFKSHEVQLEPLSVSDRMYSIMEKLKSQQGYLGLEHFFSVEEGRKGVVVTFLALMEMIRDSLVEFQQSAIFAPIYVRLSGVEPLESQQRGIAKLDSNYS